MPLKLAFSPCPNDTFMFFGLVSGAIPLPWPYDVRIGDIEELNGWAFNGETDVTKLSCYAAFQLADRYAVLHAGAALGRGCGPLVISREPLKRKDLNHARIAIPGRNTTAALLFASCCPEATDLIPMLFSDIEQAILDGEVDAGVIIHETRFTYRFRGLKKILDLGEWWEDTTGHPIPLGCIGVKREMADAGRIVDRALRASVEHGFNRRSSAYPFIREHAQELDQAVIDAHIDLYVNDYSIDLGKTGRAALLELFRRAVDSGAVENYREDIFL